MITALLTHCMIPTHFRFFGPGLIADQQGLSIPMRSRKQLALLAYLTRAVPDMFDGRLHLWL